MAILQEERTQQQLTLRALHVFGRNPAKADTLLTNGDASQIHASIRWSGKQWEIIDHSRNGTFINGQRLAANVWQALLPGQKIRFAPGATLEWVVQSLDAPSAMLLPLQGSDGQTAILLKSIHFLPDEEAPEASVYRSPLGQWIVETAQDDRVLQDGDTIDVGLLSWRFHCAQGFEVTTNVRELAAPGSDGVLFDFQVSRNEEHIVLNLVSAHGQLSLGERTHHYSLLTLARARWQDAQRGLDASCQGWLAIEQLAHMLGLEQSHLNTHLFRARNQIAREFANASNIENVIERRRGEVRFGAFAFRIVRGDELEARFNPAGPAAPAYTWHEPPWPGQSPPVPAGTGTPAPGQKQ